MKRIVLILVATFAFTFAVTSVASIIVEWGDFDGTVPTSTDIVSGNNTFALPATTFVSGTVSNDPIGASYYPDSIGKSPVFNATAAFDDLVNANRPISRSRIENNGSTPYDRIELRSSDDFAFDGMSTMVVWENFLTTDSTLESLTHSGLRSDFGTTELRFLLQKNDDSWYASSDLTWTGGDTAGGTRSIADASAASWFAFLPMVNGTATVGPLASIDMDNVKSVGFYTKTSGVSELAFGLETGYFQATATAVPEPSAILLFVGVGVVCTLARRRMTV